MYLQTESVRRRLGLLAGVSFAALLAFILGTPPNTATGQTDCSSYNQCAALQGGVEQEAHRQPHLFL